MQQKLAINPHSQLTIKSMKNKNMDDPKLKIFNKFKSPICSLHKKLDSKASDTNKLFTTTATVTVLLHVLVQIKYMGGHID